MTDTLDVSVVLPVFNEAGNIEAEVRRIRDALDASPYSYEILAVDDGSTDGSGEVLRTIPGIRVIAFAENRGSGSARRVGTQESHGNVVVWTDTDMTYPNDQIPALVKELDGHDQVVGARRTEEGTVKFFRVPAKWLIRKLASYLTQTKIPDLNSGLRAFRRPVATQFLDQLPKGFSCVTTMTMSFLANGYSVKYVPIDYFARAGSSKFHWRKDTQRYLLQVIRLVMSYEPLRFFIPIGTTLMLIGGGKLIHDVIAYRFHIATDTLLILFASFQTFAIGLIADLVVRLNKRSYKEPPASF